MCSPCPQGSPAGLRGCIGCFPGQRRPGRGPPRRQTGGAGPEGDPIPLHPCLCPGARSPAFWPGTRLQRRFEEIRVPRTCRVGWGLCRRRPGEWAGRGGRLGSHPRRRATADPGSVAHRIPPQPPPQWLAMSPPGLRLSGASSRSPQPYSPPIPGPSAPFIFLDSAWGFAGFWEIKTASNSGGVLPGQTGPGGPCALGYRLAAPSSGGRAQARAMPPRLCGGPLRSLWPQLQRRPGFLAQVVGGAVVAYGQTLGALRGWVPLGLSRCVAGAVAPPSEVSGGAC